MGNTYINATTITREFLRVLHSNLAFLSTIDRQHDGKTEMGGVKNAGAITIRKPSKYTVRTGATLNAQEMENTSSSLAITTQKGVDMTFSSAELTLNLDDFSKQFIQPAASRLAAELESNALQGMYKDVWNSVGTPGTTPASSLVWLQSGAKLDLTLTPRDGNRYALLNPDAMASTLGADTNGIIHLFNPGSNVSRAFKDGQLGDGLGFKWNMGQLMPVYTNGTRTNTTPAIHTGTSTTQGGATIVMDGETSSLTVLEGDVFTVAGVYATDEAGNSTGSLFQFVVQADATIASMTVQPMYTTGAKKNMTALPADGNLVTFIGATASGAYPQNLAYHRDAFTFATVDLEMPKGVDFSAREVMDGISIRCIRQYDINNDQFPCRIDVLYGYVAQRPELACRIWG